MTAKNRDRFYELRRQYLGGSEANGKSPLQQMYHVAYLYKCCRPTKQDKICYVNETVDELSSLLCSLFELDPEDLAAYY